MKIQIPRYVTGALLFGLIWAAIAYIEQGVKDFKVLGAGILLFVVFGSALSWALSLIVRWFRNR